MGSSKLIYVSPVTNYGQAPTLVIVGRYDQVTPVSCSQEIAKGIASARLEIFERSGHSPSSDEPEKFQEVLLDFLKKEVL